MDARFQSLTTSRQIPTPAPLRILTRKIMKIFSYYKPPYTGKHYTKFYCWLMNRVDIRYFRCDCMYEEPYGLVISGECEKHD